MSLISLIYKTIRYKLRDIIALIICTLLLTLFYYLFFDSMELSYPIKLGGAVILIYLSFEVYRFSKLFEIIDGSKRARYKFENINMPSFDRFIVTELSDIHEHYTSKINSLENEIRDRDRLFSTWIHNMKTSIAVIDLACDSEFCVSDKALEDIKEENYILKKNLEECLNLIRLDEFSRDYMTNKYYLNDIVRDVINNKRRDFIYSGIFPKVDIEDDFEVYTDKKWITYIIEQVISNAIKYSERGSKLEFYSISDDKHIVLFIKDYGVGIAQDDITRVFDPFFTGTTGRENRESTGIGLYMVKTIADRLGHKVYIDSKLNEGTSFSIVFNLSRM